VPCRRSSVRPSLWANGRRRPLPVGDWRHASWNGFETESSENLPVSFVMTKGTLQAHRETPAELLRVANSQQAEYHPTRATCRYTRASGWHANPPTKHLIERTRQRCTIQGTCAHPCAACVFQPQRRLRLFLANRLWIGRARRLRRSSSPCLLLKREEPCLTNPARRIAVTVSR